jgi:hypothetical protein
MAIRITHAKVNQIEDWTQAKLNEYINAGLYPQGTTIADITQPSDWNDDHSSSDLDGLEESVRGVSVINMANDDYTMTAAEARKSAIIVANGGTGGKTLTIPSSATNPVNYTVVMASGGPIKIVAADDTALISRCYYKAAIAYAYGVGALQLDNELVAEALSSTVTTAANTNEQIMRSTALPKSFISDGQFFEVSFNGKKSGTAAVAETLRLRLGTAGTTGDTQIWSNASVTGATDNCSGMVRFFRVNATTIRFQSITNALSPFSGSATDFADITVSDMDANSLILTFTGQHGDGTETFSNYTYLVRVFNP